MVRRSPRAASTWSISRAKSCIARSLNASVGPWNSSSDEGVHAELRQRRDRGMAKIAIGLARHAGEIGFADGIADERPDHLDGNFGIGTAGKGGNRLRLEARPGFRHIEAAVAGKAREHGLGKAERRGLAPGRDIMHLAFLTAGSRTGQN